MFLKYITLLFLVAIVRAEPRRISPLGRSPCWRGYSGYGASCGYPSSLTQRNQQRLTVNYAGTGRRQIPTQLTRPIINQRRRQQIVNNNAHKTEVHHHYHYSPPQRILYGTTYLPVYQARPPMYVYQYRNSGSRFDTLLTGLALFNLGRLSERSRNYNVHGQYRISPGEICKLLISKQNGEYEETRIDCQIMSSFIWESGSEGVGAVNQQVSTNTITKSVVETTSNSRGTVTVQQTTVVDALQVKGPSIQVTAGMQCFMIHISRDSSIFKKNVDCGILQTYAQKSLYYNDCVRVAPSFVLLIHMVIVLLKYFRIF